MIDKEIRELCLNHKMVEPFYEESLQPCSIDVHLGENIILETWWGWKALSLSQMDEECPFMMPPGAFLLAETEEYVHLPDNVEAHLHLVSSRAREGLDHHLAGLVDCGYQGRLTLELKNSLRYNRVGIYPGQRIAQLTFFKYAESAENPYCGRYYGDQGVSQAKP